MNTDPATSILDGIPTDTPAEKVRAMVDAVGRMIPRDSDFARSMAEQFRIKGYLSAKQMIWVERLTERATRKRVHIGASLSTISDIFKVAGGHLKRPKIRFDVTACGHPVALAVCGPAARVPGAVNVTDGGKFHEGTWFGRILPDGTFEESKDCTPAVVKFLIDFAQDPPAFAAEHGIKSGRCCFCRLELTDARSTKVGYGPICAGHFGLPWG